MVIARFQDVIEPPWTNLNPIRVGPVPMGLGTADKYVIVEDDQAPKLRIDIYYSGEYECYAFEELIIWNDLVVIGLGERVYLVNMKNGETKSVHGSLLRTPVSR